jgi:hypothetical protein
MYVSSGVASVSIRRPTFHNHVYARVGGLSRRPLVRVRAWYVWVTGSHVRQGVLGRTGTA